MKELVDTAALKALGSHLRALRKKTGMDGRTVATRGVGMDQPALSRVETGKARLVHGDLVRLLNTYDAATGEREQAFVLWARAHLPPEASGLLLDDPVPGEA